MDALSTYRLAHGSLRRYTDVGCYPLIYLTPSGGVLCADCAAHEVHNPRDNATAADVNWEDSALFCDGCGGRIESAYAEDDAKRATVCAACGVSFETTGPTAYQHSRPDGDLCEDCTAKAAREGGAS